MTFTAYSADIRRRYSFESCWLEIAVWMPTVECVGVWVATRSGGLISQPTIHDHYMNPDASVFESDEFIQAYLDAGIAYVQCEYSNGPHASISSRHQHWARFPRTWRQCMQALQFLQTHARDGQVTGSRLVQIPQSPDKYIMGGNSAASIMGAHIALAPDGIVPYEKPRWAQSIDKFARLSSGRCKGVYMNDPTPEFRLYDDSISGNAIAFYRPSENVLGDSFNNTALFQSQKWRAIPTEHKAALGVVEKVRSAAPENFLVGMYLDASAAPNESSYLGSGLIFSLTSHTGVSTGAVTIRMSGDHAKSATIKMIVVDGSTWRVFAEANSSTNLVDWDGTAELVDSGNATVGTADVDATNVTGNDARKAFITRQQSVDEIVASEFGQFPELSSPHPVDLAAILRHYREQLLLLPHAPTALLDRYDMGSEYPALISGDTPCSSYQADGAHLARRMDWIQNVLHIGG